MTAVTAPRPSRIASGAGPLRRDRWPARVVALGLVVASSYGLLASDPYRGVTDATVVAAKAQDVCSLVVAVGLVLLSTRASARAHLVRLGLFGYVAYSYAIFIWGVAMNRAFLVYVVLVAVAGAALLDGLVRLVPDAWPRASSRRLERGTGWFLIVVALLFAALWLSVLLPFAFGGPHPVPEGPGGAPYPVFVLDLGVALPCVAAVGLLLRSGRRIAGPLAVVVLVKIITLFSVLWVGVVAGLLGDSDVTLGPDAGPSLVMVAVCCWLLVRWLREMAAAGPDAMRPTFWPTERD
ncbi:MAG: hypothetical protein QOH37_2594 [Nocardioidaceae bacterium]|jgi:hypothetical protein|nr:hypothetical protein [Nocardioidaceae bacterium]